MTPLADLVRARRRQLYLSYAALSAAAMDPETGEGVSSGWIHRLEHDQPVIPPQTPQLRAMAVGLQVPLLRVQEAAAAQFFSLEPAGEPSADVVAVADRIQALRPDQRDALLGLLDALLEDR